LHIRFCFVLLWLPPSVVIFNDLYILLSFTHSFHFFLSMSLFHPVFFLLINRSLLYCEPRMMVMLVIMTFIYHIRSVMPFAHIFIYKYNPTESAQFYWSHQLCQQSFYWSVPYFLIVLSLSLIHDIYWNEWFTRISEFILVCFFIIYQRSMIFLLR